MPEERLVLATPATRKDSTRPPLGLMSIASYLEKHGLQADIVDVKAVHDESIADCEKQIIGQLKKLNPGIVGIPCLTPEYFDFLRLCTGIKKEFDGEVKIVTGPFIQPSCLKRFYSKKARLISLSSAKGKQQCLDWSRHLGIKLT